MAISFLSHDSQVIAERLEEVGEHVHEEDEEIHGRSSSNIDEQVMTKIISKHIYEIPNRILKQKEILVFWGEKYSI